MAKHFIWEVADGRLQYRRDAGKIASEARLNGSYVLRFMSRSSQQVKLDILDVHARRRIGLAGC